MNQSRKEIGKYIQTIVHDSKSDDGSFAARVWSAMAGRVRGESLAGIEIQSVENLRLDGEAFDKVSLLSHMQLGMADIVHLLAADSLKCTHVASTDSDFHRLRDEIESSFDFKILFKDEIFSIFKNV
jgi:predicted nucleic acid-binding protein